VRSLHLPVWLGALGWRKGVTFAALFTAEIFGRAVLTTVVPLDAYRLVGDAQKVSLLFFLFSIAGLATSLTLPWLLSSLPRRWLFVLATLVGIAGCGLLALPGLWALIAGMALRAFTAACMDVLFNLYVLDHIPRREMTRFEPLRGLFLAAPWAIGPWLGVYLHEQGAPWLPFAAAAGAGALGLAYFWFLRLTDNPVVTAPRQQPTNPLRHLRRFLAQPRLRLAWVLAFGRSAWWTMFFIYAPIYAVRAGLGEEVGGALVSLGAAALFLVPFWGALGRRRGVRRLLIGGYAGTAVATFAVSLLVDLPWLGVAGLALAAICASSLDGAGNVHFLRAVRPFERPAMTTVFSTYRDASAVVPPGIFALVLKVFELPAVFVVTGASMLALARLARYIPRRM
jgi:MFS family permease